MPTNKRQPWLSRALANVGKGKVTYCACQVNRNGWHAKTVQVTGGYTVRESVDSNPTSCFPCRKGFSPEIVVEKALICIGIRLPPAPTGEKKSFICTSILQVPLLAPCDGSTDPGVGRT